MDKSIPAALKGKQARLLVIVNDGASRWIGDRQEVYEWLSAHGHTRGYHSGYCTPNVVTLDADTYQALCDETTCYEPEAARDVTDRLQARGAAILWIY